MKDKSGISLSIRAIVILLLALVVLFAIITIFMGTVPGGGRQLNCEAELRSTCLQYSRCGCCSGGSDCQKDDGSELSCQDIKNSYSTTNCTSVDFDKTCCG